jgi:site-specific DNA-adenine methylase
MVFVQISQGMSHQYKKSPTGWAIDTNADHNHLSGNFLYLKDLVTIAEKLKMIYIDNRDVMRVLDIYAQDSGGTNTNLFYIDPPYLDSKPAYSVDFTSEQYRAMVDKLNQLSCPAAISGYNTPAMEKLMEGWECVVERELKPSLGLAGLRKTQVLWRNKRCSDLWKEQNAINSLL